VILSFYIYTKSELSINDKRMDIISILTWVSILSGGILIFLLLFSIVGGMDLEIDADLGSVEVDTESGTNGGGIGVIKGALTFISVSTWMIKVSLATSREPWVAIGIGIFAGIIAFMALNYLFRLLLRNEENVNWSIEDARNQKGEVYLKIPAEGEGIVHVEIKGAHRELKARSAYKKEIKTGDKIRVVDVEGDYVLVESETV